VTFDKNAMYDTDTIAAISTPLGEGGIGIVRISGPDAFAVADAVFRSSKGRRVADVPTHRILYGHIMDGEHVIDEVLLSVMRGPATYTRENVVEINCHGGPVALRKVLEAVLRNGARSALPGEFTQRAFLNGRIDLVQAEAVMDVITAKTEQSKRVALEQLSGGLSESIVSIRDSLLETCAHIEAYIDFPEEEIELSALDQMQRNLGEDIERISRLIDTFEEGRFYREGLSVAIVGRPNVGKSSLLNALLQRDRAIVTDTPGTTRDTIEEYLNISGVPVRVIDTAGIRESHDLPEQEGVRRSLRAIENADLVIAVFDGSEAMTDEDAQVIGQVQGRKAIAVINKSDLPVNMTGLEGVGVTPAVTLSAKNRKGIERLKETIVSSVLRGSGETRQGVIVTNIRHRNLLILARDALTNALEELRAESPHEIVALGLRDALDRLGEMVGVVTTDDILNKIFSDFCIGK